MGKKILSLLVVMSTLLAAGCASGGSGNSDDTTDSTDQTTTLAGTDSDKADDGLRIIAGTVAATQYLSALGVEVVGIPSTDKALPAEYEGLPKVGAPMAPNLEKVLACEPDVFVGDINLQATLEEMFYGMGDIKVILLDSNSYDSIQKNVDLLSTELGLDDAAGELSAKIEAKKQEALDYAKGKDQPTVAVVFGTTAAFMLATDSSYVGSLVNMLGAGNITDGQGFEDTYVTFDREYLAAADPDIILRLSHADPAETAKAFETEFSQPFWQEIKAVKEGRVYDLDPEYFGVTANFNSIDAPLILAKMIYGE